MTSTHPALVSGNVAVITGGSLGGIGFETAKLLLERYNLSVLLADVNTEALNAAAEALGSPSNLLTHICDVSQPKEVFALADLAFEKFGRVDFLFLNAGVSMPTKDFAPGGDLDSWTKTLGVNFGGVLNGTQAFVQRMVDQGTPGCVVVTGSKQGITQPPGNPAYNVSKSAVKSLTESLAHSLLPTQVSAHLLVPGWTYTKLTVGGGIPDAEKKPAGAWTAAQVAEELFARLNEFYIICPDNDCPWELDAVRIKWNVEDILKKRPALSRWHPEYKDAFAKYLEAEYKK
ncbi:short-chain dehydrogenase/reductase SDR family protein [Pseudohyphozyma bogoriensis]|nr:short-chain dehydrogenase/reductase SDR family protein [Pseudohyphozyma bogoriensis]